MAAFPFLCGLEKSCSQYHPHSHTPTRQRPFEDDFRAEISRGMPAKMYGNLVPFLNDIRDSFSVTCC